MMNTKLIQFPNAIGNTLRGILCGGNRSSRVVLMLHGFESTTTTEPKFTRLARRLETWGIASLRLDFTGCGLSDGDFEDNTISSYANDAGLALQYLKKLGLEPYGIVAHSFAACTIPLLPRSHTDQVERIVLLAPALNQRELQRFWFVRNTFRRSRPDIAIEWDNYGLWLDERAFIKDCARNDKRTKKNFVGAPHMLEIMDQDYDEVYTPFVDRTLLVHGDHDDVVPVESLTISFPKQCIVRKGDHGLERPDMIDQWLRHAADFLRQK